MKNCRSTRLRVDALKMSNLRRYNSFGKPYFITCVTYNLSDGEILSLMHWIKQSFSMNFRKINGKCIERVWQYRFWDHIIRNEKDLQRHLNYIHFNPVKHESVNKPFDYVFSSIDIYKGNYP